VTGAAALVARHVPALAGVPLRPLAHAGWGGDCDVYAAGDHIVRVPRDREVAARLADEAVLLRRLRVRSPVAVPDPAHLPAGADGLPLLMAYRRIEGAPAPPGTPLTAPAGAALGAFLAVLHEPARDPVPGARLRELLALAPLGPSERAFAAAIARPLFAPGLPVVTCHGDLAREHILLAADGTPAGVLDFTDAGAGDPAADFAWRADLGEAAFAAALAAYPAADEGLAARAAAHAALTPLHRIAHGVARDDRGHVAAGLAGLRRRMTAAGYPHP
jgi:aminoglycoside phosphotransferase (APT) family kinase protein